MVRNRREFLSDTFSAVSAFGVGAALHSLGGRLAMGESPRMQPLVEVADDTTGLSLLRLPDGFRYRSFGWTGDLMHDGQPTPSDHDGMGVVAASGTVLTMVRNHEISDDGAALASHRLQPYDSRARGGCCTLQFDTHQGQWIDSRVSLSGTSRNCAGGITPWGTWLTCEETVLGRDSIDKYYENASRSFEKEHGWIFEVDPDGVTLPRPLHALGRFVHEAIAIDRESGIVYETEDRDTAGFYRFIPRTPGVLADGGDLEMAEVIGQPDLRGGVTAGSAWDVRWHRIADPTRPHSPEGRQDELGVYRQGKALGGTTFSRLEGCWFGNGMIYFDATSGGAAKAGQIWQYDPAKERLTLLFESPAKQVLNMPDNLCVNPQGGLILCEDNDYGVNEYPQRLFSLSQSGKLTLVAENNVRLNGERNDIQGDFRNKEWAGATFSPDGEWLFINIQTPGISFAIQGDWDRLLLA